MSPNVSLRHAATTSETNLSLSPKSHVISREPASSSKPISSSKAVTKLKLRRKPGTDHLGAYHHHDQINSHEPSSPYYRGLLHQPITINNEYGSHNHHHQHNHPNSCGNNNSNSRVPTTASEGPYYKGLINFSPDIHGGQHLQSQYDYDWRIHEVEGAYKWSPYFRGLLTDSSLAMALRKIDEGGGGGGGGSCGHGGVVPMNLSSLAFNMTLCLGGKDDQISNDDITVPAATDSTGGQRTLSSLISNDDITTLTDSERQSTLLALSPPAPIPLPSPSLPLPPPSPLPLSMFTSKGM